MEINIKKLKEWISTLSYEDFNNKKVIKTGYSIDDYNKLEEIRDKCLVNELIDYGDYLIVDLEGHLILGKWTRRKYRLSNNRLVPIKIIEKLRVNNAPCANGYWIVPEKFKIP